MACLAVPMPPAGFMPIFFPVFVSKSRMASNMVSTTGGVAAGETFPVDVLIKSAPASMAISLAKRTLSNVTNSPVSKMTFK